MKRTIKVLVITITSALLLPMRTTQASGTWISFANPPSPIGVVRDDQGSVYVTADYPDVLNPHSIIIKYDSLGNVLGSNFIGSGLFAYQYIGHIAQDPTTGTIWDVTSTGDIVLINPSTLGWTYQYNISTLSIDVAHIFDVQSRTTSGGWVIPADANNTEYRDITLLRRGSQLDVFITGRYVSANFVLRLRYQSGALQSGAVIIASKRAWTDLSGSIVTTTPRGIAVNSQPTVLTSLPLQLSGESQATDHLISFSADFPNTPGVQVSGPDVTSRGMTTDSAGNFYIATGPYGTSLCSNATGALAVVFSDFSGYSCNYVSAGVNIRSEDVATDSTGRNAYMTMSNYTPSVIQWSLQPPSSGSPAVGLSSSSLTFGDQTVSSTSAVQSVTLTNTGNRSLAISNIGITGSDTADFAQTNTCPTGATTLAAGANCTIDVTFTPTSTGNRTASLSISDNASGSPQTVTLGGTGVSSVAWSVTLAASSTAVIAGHSVTLTATANQDVGSTPYWIYILDADSGDQVTHCLSGTSCTSSVSYPVAAVHNYIAKIADSSLANVQAQSSAITVTWQSQGGTPITQGWNLISVPVQGVASASALLNSMNSTGQLGSSAATLAATYGNGRFTFYVPGYSADQTLQPAQGIFVRSSVAGTWNPTGAAYTTGQMVSLQRGWNLVGVPFPASGLDGTAIVSEASSCGVQEIAIYSGDSYQTYISSVGGPFHVPATSGMWIQCTSAMNWTPL